MCLFVCLFVCRVRCFGKCPASGKVLDIVQPHNSTRYFGEQTPLPLPLLRLSLAANLFSPHVSARSWPHNPPSAVAFSAQADTPPPPHLPTLAVSKWPPASVPLRKSAVRKRYSYTKLSSATTKNPVRRALLARAQKSRECVAECVRALNSARDVRQRTHAPSFAIASFESPPQPHLALLAWCVSLSFCFITSA
jgi:hypothetical protein